MTLSLTQRIIGAAFVVLLAIGSGLIYRQNQQREAATAALVNGERIWIEPISTQIDTMRAKDPYRFRNAPGQREEERLRKLLLDERIKHKLIAQEAVKAGIKITEAEVDRILSERKSTFKSEAAFNKAIAKEGLTEDTFRSRIHESLAHLKIRIKLAKAITVAESEIQSYIRSNTFEFKGPVEQVKLSVVTTDSQATAFLEGLKEGRDFKELAEELSLPVKTAWYPTAWLDLSIAETIASAALGEHTNIFPNPDNSVSIYLLEERKTRRSEETEVTDQIRAKLLREKQQQSFRNWLDSIARSADIQTNF